MRWWGWSIERLAGWPRSGSPPGLPPWRRCRSPARSRPRRPPARSPPPAAARPAATTGGLRAETCGVYPSSVVGRRSSVAHRSWRPALIDLPQLDLRVVGCPAHDRVGVPERLLRDRVLHAGEVA